MEKVIDMIENLIKEEGYYVWDIKYVPAKNSKLEVFVDDVDLYECAELSRKINGFIESNNLITDQYLLTVSSPGINRKLTKLDHYVRSIGKNAKIKADGTTYKGIIEKVSDNIITLNTEKDNINIEFEKIEKANLNII